MQLSRHISQLAVSPMSKTFFLVNDTFSPLKKTPLSQHQTSDKSSRCVPCGIYASRQIDRIRYL
jgi:hypothetical protein